MKNYERKDATRVKNGAAWQYTLLSRREAIVCFCKRHLVTFHDCHPVTIRRMAQAVCAALDGA